MKFTFVHTADLHLDSPLQGLLNDVGENSLVGQSLQKCTGAAFEEMISLCIKRQARFLVISGDVYDGENSSLRAQLCLRDGLKRLADHGISAFILHGNHDPTDTMNQAVEWPENTHIFDCEDVETVHVADPAGETLATVSGISYRNKSETRKLQTHFSPPDAPGFHIAALHCNVGNTGHENYVPCELGELIDAGFDYWALGHVHKHEVLNESPHIVYPGCTQGRSVRELGPRGCCVVTVDTDSPQGAAVEFVALDAVRWQMIDVCTDNVNMLDSLLDETDRAIEQSLQQTDGRSLVCRIRYVGRTALFRELDDPVVRQELLERLRTEQPIGSEPFAWVESIRSECLPEADLDRCMQSQDLLGETLRIAAEAKQNSGLLVQLKESLDPLLKHRRARKILEPPSEDELKQMLDDAALLCYELLTEEDA